MATDMLQYLDPDGLDETVLNIGQIKTNLEGQISDLGESIEEELQNLSYARPDGIYPDMTVGAVIGADETAQWAQRESTGSGSAIVRSVQGAAVALNQYAKMVNRTATSKGITFTAQDGKATFDAPNGAEGAESFYMDINNIYTPIVGHKYIAYGTNESETIIFSHPHMGTLRNTVFTTQATQAGQFNLRVSADFTGTYECYPMLFDLTQMFGSGNEPTTVAEFEAMYPEPYYPYSAPTLKPVQIAGIRSTDAQGGELDSIEWTAQTLRAAGSVADMLYADHVDVNVGERAYQSGDESDASVRTDGTTTYYPLTTTTTMPISPALPMTYKVQQGGSESIIVPDGEVSAAPVLTIAEPVNAGDEFARIWAAIQSLGYTRNAAQLSRPVSLTDIGSIDETQKDTTDVVEIDTTKEVQE